MISDFEYNNLSEAEYMIDDCLIIAEPITFEEYCEDNEFESNQYAKEQQGYSVSFSMFQNVFMPRDLFESISSPSEY